MGSVFVMLFRLDYIARKVKFLNLIKDRCKNDCNNRGECDLNILTCKCNKGFAGEECSKELCPKYCSVKILKF